MKFKIKEYPELKKHIEKMSVKQLIDCVCCPDTHVAWTHESEYPTDLVFLHPATRQEAADRIKKINKEKTSPAIIVADIECGSGGVIEGCVKFPSMMALGKIGDADMAYAVGRASAKDAVREGYRWSLAPCVDIVYNVDCATASIRAAGEDPQTVIDICGGYMRGLQDGGVAATIKHFPGDGVSKYDQHLTTAINDMSEEEWMNTFGKVYSELIEMGAMSVMPGHISLPAYDDIDPETGVYPPATLSKKLMKDLLRDKLGFEGIIISDAINMSGFSGYMNLYKACATFIKNGGDVLLFPRMEPQFYNEMESYVESGYLPIETLKATAYRIKCFVKFMNEEFAPVDEFDTDLQSVSDSVVEKSVTVALDKNKTLPFELKEDTKILHAIVMNHHSREAESFDKALRSVCNNVETVTDPGPEFLFYNAYDKKYDLIICSCGNGVSYGTNVVRLHGTTARNMMWGWTKMGTPSVFIAYRHPYLDKEYPVLIDTLINTYGTAEATNRVLLDKLFGGNYDE